MFKKKVNTNNRFYYSSDKSLFDVKLLLVILVIVFSLSIGYSAFGNDMMISDIATNVRLYSDIRVTSVNIDSSNNGGISNYEDYNVRGMMSEIDLPNEDSSVIYRVIVTNFGSIDMSLYDIDGLDDSLKYELINYDLGDMLCDDNDDCNLGISKDILIKIKYNDGCYNSDNTTFKINLDFVFLHQVKYIGTTGTQYIDTGIKPDNKTTFDISFSLNNIETTQAILGTRTNMNEGPFFNLWFHDRDKNDTGKWKLRWDEYDQKKYIDLNYNEGSLININKSDEMIKVTTNGSTFSIDSGNDEWFLSSNIYLFNQNQVESDETRCALINLFYFKIYQDKILVRDYIPVIDNNGIVCLFDKVSREFFYNIGDGEFNYNEDYTNINYIESSGNQYIDTLVKGNSNSKVEFVMSLNNLDENTRSIFGARTDMSVQSFNMFYYKSKIRWDYDTYKEYPDYGDSLNGTIYVYADKNLVNINDNVTEYNYTSEIDTVYNMYIFTVNTANNLTYVNDGMKLYYFKIKSGDIVVRNFIPVKDRNGVVCLYDLVSREFFYNKGTDLFIGG